MAVVIASDQSAVPVSGTFWQATQPVSGTFWQATQPVSGPLTDTQLRATAVPVSGTFWQATQPVSAASLPLPTGAATEVTLAAASAKLPATLGQKAMAASLAVVIASDQSAVPVSGTFWQATQPISAASLPLPTGASTEATLSALSGKHPATLGQKAMTASMAVVIASDQSAVPVSGTFWQATQPVSAASLPLPTGASTEVTLAAASAKLPATLGQKAMTASMAVVIASDQGAVPVSGTFWQATQPVSGTFWQATQPISAASLPLPTGAATEATLLAESAKLPATLGQKAMAASMAVVIASDQGAVPVSGTFWQATQPVSGTFWQATQPVSGPLTDTQLRATPVPVSGTVAVTGPLTDTQLRATPVPVSGTVTATGPLTDTQLRASAFLVKGVRSSSPAQTSPSVTVASTVILASNANRLGATIYNESGAICYAKLGATASLTSYSVQIAIGGYYEVPFAYTGAIDGITASGTAILRVTEIS
jgi:hypothetical protein